MADVELWSQLALESVCRTAGGPVTCHFTGQNLKLLTDRLCGQCVAWATKRTEVTLNLWLGCRCQTWWFEHFTAGWSTAIFTPQAMCGVHREGSLREKIPWCLVDDRRQNGVGVQRKRTVTYICPISCYPSFLWLPSPLIQVWRTSHHPKNKLTQVWIEASLKIPTLFWCQSSLWKHGSVLSRKFPSLFFFFFLFRCSSFNSKQSWLPFKTKIIPPTKYTKISESRTLKLKT